MCAFVLNPPTTIVLKRKKKINCMLTFSVFKENSNFFLIIFMGNTSPSKIFENFLENKSFAGKICD